MSNGKTVGDGLDDLGLGFAFVGGGIALAGFFLGMSHCGAAEKDEAARRYEACMRATSSIAQCGKP